MPDHVVDDRSAIKKMCTSILKTCAFKQMKFIHPCEMFENGIKNTGKKKAFFYFKIFL